jgi:pilus assembly protein Flp/PilA
MDGPGACDLRPERTVPNQHRTKAHNWLTVQPVPVVGPESGPLPGPFLVGRNLKLAVGQGGSMKALWQAFSSDESGQGLVEYALIIALVAVGLIAILLVLRNSIGNVFNNAATQLNNAPANPYP